MKQAYPGPIVAFDTTDHSTLPDRKHDHSTLLKRKHNEAGIFVFAQGRGDKLSGTVLDSWSDCLPGRRGRRIFSRLNFLCRLLYWYMFYPRVTAVAHKGSWSF